MITTNPETMRTVSESLKTFDQQIEEAKAALTQAVSSAADGWQDNVYTDVAGQIEELVASVNVSEHAQQLASHIEGKATSLEEYNAG